jgi:hypothetical protein
MLWFTLVFFIMLKIPLAYLCYVVWWAVKDAPAPGEGYADAAGEPEAGGPEPWPGSWWRRRLPRRPPARSGPHGSPARRPAPVLARARSRSRP